MREYLKNISCHYKGDYFKIKYHFEKRLPVPNYDINCNYITILDKMYPKSLKELQYPPFVLYYEGNIELLYKRKISIVGSRNASIYSQEMTSKLVKRLRDTYVCVSGMAKGIDTIVHNNSLDFYSIGVLGCGVDVCYPIENKLIFDIMRTRQLIISEYPPSTNPQAKYFPFRNRIIAALGEKIYIMSAAIQSGTMHTVNYGLELDKEIICLPHPVTDKYGIGCNKLIEEGAQILVDINDV